MLPSTPLLVGYFTHPQRRQWPLWPSLLIRILGLCISWHSFSGWWFFATPLKNMSSSIGMMTFPTKMGKCQKWQPFTTNQLSYLMPFSPWTLPLWEDVSPIFRQPSYPSPWNDSGVYTQQFSAEQFPILTSIDSPGFSHVFTYKSWWNPTCSASKLRCRSEIVGCRSRHFFRPHTGSVQTPCCFLGNSTQHTGNRATPKKIIK